MKTRWFCLLMICTGPLIAQAQESLTLVPFDSAGTVEVIDNKLARRLMIYQDVVRLMEVRLYSASDSVYYLEITARPKDRIVTDRRRLTRAEADILRNDIQTRLNIVGQLGIMPDQEGRVPLVVATGLMSFGYYGWAIPFISNSEDARSNVGLYLLIGATGVIVPALITEHHAVSQSTAILYGYGLSRGVLHGIMLVYLVGGRDADDHNEGRGVVAAGLVGSWAEGMTALALTSGNRMSAGRAEMICVGGDLGALAGLGLGHLTAPQEGDKTRAWTSAVLGGSAFGMTVGYLAGRGDHYSVGDGRAAWGLAVASAFLPMAVLASGDEDRSGDPDDKVYFAAGTAGLVTGTVIGLSLTRDKDFTAGQGFLINMGMVAGGLFGLGIASMVDDGNDSSSEWLMSGIGSVGGWVLAYTSESSVRKREFRTGSTLDVLPMLTVQDAGNGRRIPAVGVHVRF